MGGSAKKVVGVAVSIAVPFVAPKIVGAIAASSMVSGTALGAALSTTAGATAGSALVGAGLGAAGASITGGDVGRGAILGAIGGGIGGYGAAQAAQASAVDPYSPFAGASGVTAADPYSLAGSGAQLGVSGTTAAASPYSLAGTGAQLGASSVTGATAGLAASPYSLAGAGASLPSFGAAAAPAASGSFMNALASVPAEVAQRFSDPSTLADLTLRAGASLLTGELAGDGLSDQERELLQAQMTELQQLRETDEELFKTRLQEAMNLLGEARYFDPAAFGMRAMADVQLAGAQATREAERAAALRPGQQLSAADRRRAGLDITARGQAAYARGAESAQQQRMTALQAGLSQLPDRGPTSALNYGAGLSQQFALADERRRQTQQDMGDWFGSITGSRSATSIG